MDFYIKYFILFSHIAHDKEALQRIKATHIINAAQGQKFNQIDTTENYYADLQLKFMGISAVDTPKFKLHKHFDICADFIHTCLENGGIKKNSYA